MLCFHTLSVLQLILCALFVVTSGSAAMLRLTGLTDASHTCCAKVQFLFYSSCLPLWNNLVLCCVLLFLFVLALELFAKVHILAKQQVSEVCRSAA